MPIGQTQGGVQIAIDRTGASGPVAYARLLVNGAQLATGQSSGGNPLIAILNPVPLVPTLFYQVQVQFGTSSSAPDWKNPLTAPVLPIQLRIPSLSVSPAPNGQVTVAFTWEAPGGTAVAGIQVMLVDLSAAGGPSFTEFFFNGTGSPASFPATLVPGHDYAILHSAVQPLQPQAGGGFSPLQTFGPQVGPVPIPTKAPVLSQAAIEAGTVAAHWTAPTLPAGSAVDPQYDLLLLDGSAVVGVAAAGPAGGQAAAAALASAARPQVAARMRFGAFSGPAGPAFPVYPVAPSIGAVFVSGSEGTALIEANLSYPAPLPAGGSLVATLYVNGSTGPSQTLEQSAGQVRWSGVAVDPGSVYEVSVSLVVTVPATGGEGGGTSLGPSSPRLTVPLTAPQNVIASYDGQTLWVEFLFDAHGAVDGYLLKLTADGVQPQLIRAGPAVPIAIPLDLDISKAWEATVVPLVGIVEATPVLVPVTPPTVAPPNLVSLDYDGATLVARWSAATLPFLSGYRVSVTNARPIVVGAGEASCAIPLSPGAAKGASATVTGLSPLRETAASAPLAIMSELPSVTSIAVDPASGGAKAGWAPAAGATRYRLRLTQDGEATEFYLDGTARTYSFTPLAGSATALSLAAVADGGGARSTGPFGPAAPLPPAAPSIASTAFAGDRLELAWTPVAGALGYRATIFREGAASPELKPDPFGPGTRAASIPFTPTAADGSYSAVIQALFGPFEGPPSPAAPVLVAAPTLSPPEFDGRTLTAAIAAPAGPAPSAYALRLLRDTVEIERRIQPAGAAAALAPAEPAMAGAGYVMEARAGAGIALGPPASVAAVLAAPAVTAIAWNGTIEVTAALGSATAGVARLLADGIAQPPVALDLAGKASLTIPAEGALALSVQGDAGGATGPWSLPIALSRAAPDGIALRLDGSVLGASWRAVPGADAYEVTLGLTGAAGSSRIVAGTAASFFIPPAATAASVSVGAIDGIVTGPASSSVAALLGPVEIEGIDYDGRLLALRWKPVDGAQTYRLALAIGTTVVAEAEFTGTSGSVAVAPGPYAVILRAAGGSSVGPAQATPSAAMTGAPEVSGAAFDPASGDCTLSWPSVAGASSYSIRLEAADESPFEDTIPSSPSPVIYRVPAARLSGGEPWTFTCRALAAGPPALSGPWSEAFVLPDAVPANLRVQLDGTTVTAAWDAVDSARGYVLTLVTDKGSKTAGAFEPRAVLTLPTGATVATLAVAAILGRVTGRSSLPLALLFAPAELTGAVHDGSTLSLSWQPVNGASSYRVEILAGSTILEQVEFASAQGALPLAPGACDVVVRALAGGAAGPASLPLTPMTLAPEIVSIALDTKGNIAIDWTSVAGAGGYDVMLTAPGQTSIDDTTTATDYPVAAGQLVGRGWSFSCQAVAAGGVFGPWSQPVRLPDFAPVVSASSFDGKTIRAEWIPVAGAEGYRVSLLTGGVVGALADVEGARVEIAPRTAPAAGAALVVQALFPLGPGPASGPPSPILQMGWFVSGTTAPALAPLAGPDAAPADLVLALPDLFGDSGPGQLPAASASFNFAPLGTGYSLTILAGGPAWKWDDSSRAALRTDYAALLSGLETARWTAQARALTLEAIARALPQRFDESAWLAFGFEPGKGRFDLRPGMILHVEYESFQSAGSGADPAQAPYLEGFTAAAEADYPVTGAVDGESWFVTLDPALAAMAGGDTPGIKVPEAESKGGLSGGGGGLIDAFFGHFRQPLCSVVYPPAVLGPDSPGDARIAANPVLIAASSLADLDSAADAVRNASALPASVGAFYFRGRATLSPRIRVVLDGAPLTVSVGTTVGDVLAQHGARGAAPAAGLVVRRATGPAAILPASPASLDVRLDWAEGGGPQWLDLPLLPGDRIETRR
jgi:hypothetical protein